MTEDRDETAAQAKSDEALGAAVAEALAPAAALAEVQALEARNTTTLQRLAAQGVGIPGEQVDRLRFAVLCDVLLGDLDSPARLHFETTFQRTLGEKFAEAEASIARAKLLAPGQIPPAPNGATQHRAPRERPGGHFG